MYAVRAPTTLRRLRAPQATTASVRRVKRLLRAVKILLRDDALPRWLRGLAAFAALPIPGPVDEVALVLVAAVLWIGYRERLRSAWRKAA